MQTQWSLSLSGICRECPIFQYNCQSIQDLTSLVYTYPLAFSMSRFLVGHIWSIFVYGLPNSFASDLLKNEDTQIDLAPFPKTRFHQPVGILKLWIMQDRGMQWLGKELPSWNLIFLVCQMPLPELLRMLVLIYYWFPYF